MSTRTILYWFVQTQTKAKWKPHVKAMVRVHTNHFMLVCEDTNQGEYVGLCRHKPRQLWKPHAKAMVRVHTNHFMLVCEDTNQGKEVCADTNQSRNLMQKQWFVSTRTILILFFAEINQGKSIIRF